ncbi:MAG: restriction endonuclease [Candidatus Electryonea clarkiae]|nr:restriction endonuclease [Candidatus Electryonea clarkiae]MDP8289044.1 restriction endonuclease [Candidatus Electryonea clarkiae]
MAYREMWEAEVRHEELNKYRHIRGSDRHIVEQKATAQKLVWDEMWEKKQAAEQKKMAKEAAVRSKEEKKELAITKTKEAQEAINQLETILLHTLKVDDAIDWNILLNKKKYPEKKPAKPKPVPDPDEPDRSFEIYKPYLGFFDKLFPKLRKRKEDEAEEKFTSDHKAWEKKKHQIHKKNKKLEIDHAESVKNREINKSKFEEKQEEGNKRILEKKNQYLNKELDAISDYCEMVLANSEYPDYFPQEWDLDYLTDTKILIVDYSLPDIDILPTVKTVKYIITRDEFTETNLSNAALNKLYDELLYQIALRTIHELYEADVVDALDSIVINGWVESIDKATGQNTNACIMSLQASKDEFLTINLEKVDPKACFKQLKGIGSSKLHGLSPVAPIISIDKEDRRFVSAYDVVDGVDESDNLATMDWQDFENLIREIFEKEFVSSGGEVKITQASRDGGVDAVAFDPDPIRGGKIVIQAKRYTNTVGVSAVRDLYGTVVNEGATKGILVTTADYGPDAYKFAKGKPLTLLNGSNLLHLLEKHGHRAKIDLKEAKIFFAEQKT